ncbi:alpha/beta fold hydrolase [Actinomadura parmotrematis]|uniref:Alpha/beta hydrolase n=1 Tax=Actinomadura parmotrematis TaxID=2864039 RepID=A0ABS7FXT4_9ACTN|nr:alpha/beta hydrolase [Actinomadura parmotrematis]MBW8484785.1 alpha/beta hydrolase [Actinomadura parmotrematis]
MALVCARGVRFNVVDLGRPAAPGGPAPLVMLHGLFTGSAASWFFTVAPALARARPVRLLDWRGHGLSERTPGGYDAATLAADLAALTADLPPFAVAGHSHGATVAVRFARTAPGRVTRLVLVDPPFADVPAADAVAAAGRLTPRATALLERTSVLADLAAEPAVTEGDLRGLGGLPVLAAVGTGSPYRPAARLVSRALPAARVHELAGGHDLHVAARARLTPLIADFLEEAHA